MTLFPNEQRVLGALIEKEITTPEYYPLSLNSLQAATNQRSSRDPVMTLDEPAVRSALNALEQLAFVAPVRDSRVPRFEHRARTVLNLRRDETALLCLLLLRGPQTPGELRARADRLFPFDDLDAVVSALNRLVDRSDRPASGQGQSTGPLVAILPRQPGARESRYMHLLGPAPIETASSSVVPAPASPSSAADLRLAALEQRLDLLERRLQALEDRSPSSTAASPSSATKPGPA